MLSPHSPIKSFRSLGATSGRSGVALVLVLGCLVIITVLIVAFLQAVRTDVAASHGYASGAVTRMLADSTVNEVIGQIQEATQRPGEAWISQPGLIRTFDVRGNAARAYKLYSSDQMVVDGDFNPVNVSGSPSDVATDWKDQGRNVFADLNAPFISDGVPVYPIIDPAALNEVEGFNAPTEDLKNEEGKLISDPSGVPYQALPMPVKWIYVMQDGTRGTARAAAGSGGREYEIYDSNGVKLQDPANPPVARIAFWTDDDSSKVNINTASEGTFMDTPVANTWPSAAGVRDKKVSSSYLPNPRMQYELDLAYFQPRQHEFQRYPGHPATTSLSPVLWKPLARALGIAASDEPSVRNQVLDAMYSLTPRIEGGQYSSKGGTQSLAANAPPNGKLPTDQNRLYSSLDELLFAPEMTGKERKAQPLDSTRADARRLLHQLQFFLTAHSRAPEVNLFNKPRVACWPLTVPSGQPESDARLTGFDKLIKFCSTIGPANNRKLYAFTRSNPHSSTEDLLNSSRNMEIYEYLRAITSQAIPGFGGQFASKYERGERDQILTQVFDYIRCLNLVDVTMPGAAYTPNNDAIRGQVVPIKGPNNTRGFGRFPTISEIAVCFRRWGPDLATSKVQVMLLPELFCPMAGYSALARNFKVTFSGLQNFTVNGSPIFQTEQHTMFGRGVPTGTWHSRYGGYMGPLALIGSMGSVVSVPPNGELSAASLGTSMAIRGSFTVKIEAPYETGFGAPEVVQEFTVEFPDATLSLPVWRAEPSSGTRQWVKGSPGSYSLGAMNPAWDLAAILNGNDDRVRSVVPTAAGAKGDLRLVAGLANPGALFAKADPARYGDTSVRCLNNLRTVGKVAPGATFGSLVPGAMRADGTVDIRPDVPAGVSAADILTGDWDNSPGVLLDGAMLNKADEGSTRAFGTSDVPYIGDAYVFQVSGLADATAFSPNRQMPSPVMFGSLPTGIQHSKDSLGAGGNVRPWMTLLFRPSPDHPGAVSPKDHLLLDLFWMPIVEPYAISEPFSTAGKINLNYQIAPFTYISRKTGLHAVMKSTKITALNPSARPAESTSAPFIYDYKVGGKEDSTYRRPDGTWPGQDVIVRRDINVDLTLKQLDDRFRTNRPFVSASEICEIPLVPADIPATAGVVNAGITNSTPVGDYSSKLQTFWDAHKLTGDNSLERPYAHLYPRLTTKSNTFTAHIRVQSLKAPRLGTRFTGRFSEGRVQVVGDFRGAFVLERYLDPGSDTIVKNDGPERYKPVAEGDPEGFLGPYKVRVISSKQHIH